MRILAIDPGSAESGWVLMDADTGAVLRHGKDANEQLLAWYRTDLVDDDETLEPRDVVVVEFMAPRGMPTSEHEMDALWWLGRFTEALEQHRHLVVRVTRDEVKWVILQKRNVKGADAAIRAVIIDRYAQGGGRAVAMGKKAAPGPLYGIVDDQMAALALACAYQDDARDVETERRERIEKKRAEASAKAERAARRTPAA